MQHAARVSYIHFIGRSRIAQLCTRSPAHSATQLYLKSLLPAALGTLTVHYHLYFFLSFLSQKPDRPLFTRPRVRHQARATKTRTTILFPFPSRAPGDDNLLPNPPRGPHFRSTTNVLSRSVFQRRCRWRFRSFTLHRSCGSTACINIYIYIYLFVRAARLASFGHGQSLPFHFGRDGEAFLYILLLIMI